MTSRVALPLGADDLARHAAFLNRLARALARGDEADDLVQDAYLTALSHPPDPDRPARPWFAAVMRNLVRMRRRGEARGRAREAVWEGERRAVPTPDELVERALAHRALAEQVVLLDEPYRRTLLLRYVEGLETIEIAAIEGVAAPTIRWRIKQGLDRLREALSRDGERRWMRAIGPAAIGPVSAMSRGALIMKTKTKVALAALALLAAGGAVAVAVRRDAAPGPGDHPAERARPAPPTAAAHLGSTPPAPTPARPADTRPLALVAARAELDPSAARGSIEGRVVNWSSGQPVPGAEVVLSIEDGATITVVTDAAGGFRFEPDRAGRLSIAAITAAGYLPFAPEWGHSPIELTARPGVRVRDLVIYLTPAVDYTGLVVDAGEKPVAGADVRIVDLPAREQEIISIPDRFTSDQRGEFHFHAPDGALFEARARGHGPGRARLDGNVAVTHRLTLRLAEPGGTAEDLGSARVTGLVVDGEGQPVPGTVVVADPSALNPGPPTTRGRDPAELIAPGRATAGSDGRFTIEGLDPGDYQIEARDGERTPARAAVTLRPRTTSDVRLVLTPGAILRGHVHDATGASVPAFTVVVFEGATLGRGDVIATRTFVDRDGAFTIEGLAARDYQVRATAHGHAPSPSVPGTAALPPEPPTDIDIVLPTGGTLTGRVRSGDGKPIEGARATVEGGLGDGASPVPFYASAVTDASGTFVLRGLSPGRRSVVVAAYQHHGTILTGIEVAEGAEIGPVEVTLQPLADGEQPTVELAGVGAALAATDTGLIINQIVPGGGAQAANLSVGDVIIAIDGRPILDIGFEDAIQAIRGPVGTVVRLRLIRASGGATVEIPVQRVKIRL